jgi:hypothetical protein
VIHLERNLHERLQTFHPRQYTCNFLFAKLPPKCIANLLNSTSACYLSLQLLQRALILIQGPILDTEIPDRHMPWVVMPSFETEL